MLTPTSEAVVVTDVNTFAPLANVPVENPITMIINGRGFFPIGPDPAFTVSGNIITWVSTLFSVSPDDEVIVTYYYYVSA